MDGVSSFQGNGLLRPIERAQSFGLTVEPGFGDEFHAFKSNVCQKGQEILSRYGAALSAEPTLEPILEFLCHRTTGYLVGQH